MIGGLVYVLGITFLSHFSILDIYLDFSMDDCFMLLFYSNIGFTARPNVLRKGGRKLFFLGLSIVLAISQNMLGIGLSILLHIKPLAGLAYGSISMTGGHGTSAVFAKILEQKGFNGAVSISLAAATFGLITGGIIGGPIGKLLSQKSTVVYPEQANNKNNFESKKTLPMKIFLKHYTICF